MKKRRIVLIGYNVASQSLRNLQAQIKELKPLNPVLRVKKDSNRYVRRPRDVVVTWGPVGDVFLVDIAQEQSKKIASNKLDYFRSVTNWNSANPDHTVNTPEWTTDKTVAQQWYDAGITVVARKFLSSHSGKGISLHNGENSDLNPYHTPLPDVPLYVKYKKKKDEYRVHVFNGKVIDITQKKRKAGFEGHDNQIRNHQNGWVYCREGVVPPQGIDILALNACNAIGLSSGAVDIIYNQHENKCYVLEINTAPGVEGTTCLKYAQEIVSGI